MKTVIVYFSKHHGNTKKLLDAIAAQAGGVDLIDASEASEADLDAYDRIGFASGIYYSKFHKTVLSFAEKHLPSGKDVFFIYTCGSKKMASARSIRAIAEKKQARILGNTAVSVLIRSGRISSSEVSRRTTRTTTISRALFRFSKRLLMPGDFSVRPQCVIRTRNKAFPKKTPQHTRREFCFPKG